MSHLPQTPPQSDDAEPTESIDDMSASLGDASRTAAAAAAASEAVKFASLIGRLKTTPRTGWVRRGVPKWESVADHSWRVAALSLLLLSDDSHQQTEATVSSNHQTPPTSPPLDIAKCMQLAIVHDMAECLVGDIAPDDGVSSHDKHQRETTAMHQLANTLGKATTTTSTTTTRANTTASNVSQSSPYASQYLQSLFDEYETRATREAKVVKDLDRLDMILQAMEYETVFGLDLGDFFTSTPPSKFQNAHLQSIAQQIHDTRNQFQKRQQTQRESSTFVSSSTNDSLSATDKAFVQEFGSASTIDTTVIEQVVRALRGWEGQQPQQQNQQQQQQL